eukprot:s435_g5.t1
MQVSMRLRQSSLGDTALNKTSDQLPLIIPMLKWFDCSRKRTRQASASAEGIACKDLSHDSGLIALSKLLCQLPCCILCWGHRVAAGAGTHGAVSPSPRLKSKLFSVTLSHQRHLGLDEVAAVWNNSLVAPQILDFFPKIGVAGETVLVELTGRRFPEIIPIENKTFVECTLGGDGYRAPAVLLSDKRAMCNISSPVAGNFKLGLIFANMLQVSARRKMNFGKVGVEQAPQVLDLTDSTTEECLPSQVFCQPPPPAPALTEVPTQRSFDVSSDGVVITLEDQETTDFRYWIWEVLSVVPDTVPLQNSGYVITFSVPPKNGMACRLYPGGEQVFAALLTNTSIVCETAIGSPGTYSLQVAEAPDFQFATLPLTIEVYEQPQILQISPTEVLPGEGYTLSLLASRFPEQRLTFSSFRCQVGPRLVVGEVSTSRVATCQLTAEDVHAIGPETHPVEVLVDGRHQSRSEPQVFLRVHPERPHVLTLPLILPELDWWHDAEMLYGQSNSSFGIPEPGPFDFGGVCTSGPPGLEFFDVTEDADDLAALCPGCGIVCDENAEHRLPGSDGRSGMGALRRVLYPRVRAVTPTAAIVNLATPLSIDVSQLPPMVSARCDFEMFGSVPAQIFGSMVHCTAPKLREEARISLRLRLTLRTAATDIVQRLVVTVQEDFRFLRSPKEPVVEALMPHTAVVGEKVFLEWLSHAPLFEVLARVPYRCSWRQSELGDMSTVALALSAHTVRCVVPVGSTPHATWVRLEGPTGQVVVDGPLFRYIVPMVSPWWLEDTSTTPSASSMASAVPISQPTPAGPAPPGEPPMDPERLAEQALVVDAVPLSVVPPTTLTIVVKSLSPSRGAVTGGTTVRVTVRIPEDTDEPYALWCVFGDHPPTQAIRADGDGQTWNRKLEGDRLGLNPPPWMDLLCRTPEHPIAEQVPFYVTRSNEFRPGSAPDGSRMFSYTPYPEMFALTPALVSHFSVDREVTIHLEDLESGAQSVLLSTLNDNVDCALLGFDTATTNGDWACLALNASDDVNATEMTGCKGKTLGQLFDGLGGSSNSIPISGYAISTEGILSKGSQLADGNGLAAVSCMLPTQFIPHATAGQDLAMDPIPTRAAVRKTGYESTESYSPKWLEPGEFPVKVEADPTEPAIGPPIESHFDLNFRIAVSFNGPDGDFYIASGRVASTPFSLPYALERPYGWAEGGAAVKLHGVTWPEDADLDLTLIFVFSDRDVMSHCHRVSMKIAECVVPTPATSGSSTVPLKMMATRSGETATYDLPGLSYNFMAVPTVDAVVPNSAALAGGTWIEVTGGPFDARVEYWCVFLPPLPGVIPDLPAFGRGPGRYLNFTTILCETPRQLLPSVCTLTLASDQSMTNLGIGHLPFEFYAPMVVEEEDSEYNASEIVAAAESQRKLAMMSAQQAEEPTPRQPAIAPPVVPDEPEPVPVFPANNTALSIPSSTSFVSSAFNITTYQPGVRILHIAPRSFLPYRDSTSGKPHIIHLTVGGLSENIHRCVVRFGDVDANATRVANSSLIETIVPPAFANITVPLHIYCGQERLQVTYPQTWNFRYVFLPEVHAVDPEEADAQSREWLTLHGRYFEDYPGRACMIGGQLVQNVAVRWLSSSMVQCRMPLWKQDAPLLSVAYSNDGAYFSSEVVVVNTWVRIRLFDVQPRVIYVAEPRNISLYGFNFIPGLQCLFNDFLRVAPFYLQHEMLTCEMPPAFMKVGVGNVTVRLVMRSDYARQTKYALEEGSFSIALDDRPPPMTVQPADYRQKEEEHEDRDHEMMDAEFRRYNGHLMPPSPEDLPPGRPNETVRSYWFPSTVSDGSQVNYPRISISPQRSPLDGIEVIMRTDGFYIPPYARCRCRFGSTQVPAYCVARRQQVQCRAPPVTGAQTVEAQFSVNDGADWGYPPAKFAYYAPPLFDSISPPLGSLQGVNNVSVYIFQFPQDSSVSMYCRWQGTFVVPASVGGNDHIICAVPSHRSFAPWARTGDDMPLTLEVSFAGIPPVWIPLPRSLHFRQHNIPVRATQELFVSPRHGVASKGGADLTLTGNGFVFPTVNSSLVGCVFGRSFFSIAVVSSPTTMMCRAPPLASITMAEPPVDVTVDLSFDGGQTMTNLNNFYSYLRDFEFSGIIPSGGLFSSLTQATLSGKNFRRTPNLYLQFGEKKASAALANAESLRTIAPIQDEAGTYPILYSVDNQTFVPTGLYWIASATSLVRAIIPDRGFRVGGTNVTLVTTGLYWLPSLACVFGYAPVSVIPVYDPADPSNPRLTCLTPPCEKAMYLDGIGPQDTDEDCYGFVTVQMTFNGRNMFGNLSYEYVKMPQVFFASPFPAGGFNNEVTIALFGENFQEPMWCRWWNLEESMATDVTPAFMRCRAPSLPPELQPDNTTAHSVLSYFEVSPNGQDWTRFKRAWLWYRESQVLTIEPNTTFRTFAPEGDFIITGRYFRLLQEDLVQCVWLYDKFQPAERTPAVLLAPDVLRCRPSQPAAASGVDTEYLQPIGVSLEISMSTQVDSASGMEVLAEDRMELIGSSEGLYPGPAVFPTSCLVTGGCTLTLRGERLWAEDETYGSGNRSDAKLFVAVGDHLLEARRGKDSNWATIRLPPTPHMAVVPRTEPLRLTRNLQDYTPPVVNIAYNPIPIGTYYRAELHNGTLQACPQGHACPGIGANQSELDYSGESPIRCLPGSWMNATGYFECETCPEGVYCPRYAMIEPEHCETGYLCWGGTGFDANLALCPGGQLCVRPPYGKTPSSSTSRFPFVRRLKAKTSETEPVAAMPEEETTQQSTSTSAPSRRLLLAAIPSTVEIQTCPAGFFCPPGSIAQMEPSGELDYLSPMQCTRLGIVCAEGSSNPLSSDVMAGPGEYVAFDNSGVLPCPVGMSCPGGTSGVPQPCPPGQFQVSSGAPACSTCTAGTICPGFGSALPQLCPAGRVCAHPGRQIPSYLCPAGSYCPPGVVTLNTLASLDDNGPKICPPGVYCMAGTSTSVVDPTSMDTAKQCTVGTYCGANATTAGGTDNCPPRWYCPAGVSTPQPTPPGHYVGRSGRVYPSKCRPGTYAANWLMIACDPCPAGTECPLDGTVVPTVCRPGSYREATEPGEDPTKNVMCQPCPQGTWSEQGGLTSVLDCKNCDQRYVCPMEGTIRFATIDQPCPPGASPTDVCYENSQGWDCPQGYGCGPATTSFTQYDFYCEAGFWCKVRTIPAETRNLLCPAGYYCKRETGESGGSGRRSFRCPPDYFCPEGTAAEDLRVDNQLVVVLHNVQSRVEIVTQPDLTRGSMCRICSDLLPPGVFDLTQCRPCGQIVPLSYFEELALLESGRNRRLANATDWPARIGEHWVAMPENYSSTNRGKQFWVLPPGYTEEPVEFADVLPDEVLQRALEEMGIQERMRDRNWLDPAVTKMVSDALKREDGPSPPVVGSFAEPKVRQLQDQTAAVQNDTNSSNDTLVIKYQCAPDITVADTIPWELGSERQCYTAVEAWKGNLKCPRGTFSTIGSISPEDCIQQGRRIAVTNINKCYPPRPCSGYDPTVDTGYSCAPEEILCGITEDLEIYAADETGLLKKSFIFGQPVEDFPDSKLVNFFGYDPDVDGDLDLKPWVERPFTSFNMKPLDIVILDFAFDKISPTTLVNAGGAGHFNISIHTNLLPDGNIIGHLLPPFFERSINTDLHVPTQMKILALSEPSPFLPLMTKGSNARVAQAMALASAAAAGSAFSMMAAPQASQSRVVTRASGPSPVSAPSSGGVAGVTGLVGAGLVASAALSRSVQPRGGKKNLVSMAARGGESYDALVKDLETLVKEKECGPILVRLSWHDAGVFSDGKLKGGCPNAAMRFTDGGEGTFGANAGLPDVWHDAGVFSDGKLKGGCPNAAMRFTDGGEGTFGANAGLPDVALGLLKPITEKYVPDTIGHADLWTLAANVAIKEMGGPDIKTRFGRKDAESSADSVESQVGRLPDGDKEIDHLREIFADIKTRFGRKDAESSADSVESQVGRLPDGDKEIDHLREIFAPKGFSDKEIVALSGAHTVGKCHLDRSGFDGPWTEAPLKFDNSYFKDMLAKEWTDDKSEKGNPQFKSESGTIMLISDLALLKDPAFKEHVEKYAADQDAYFADFTTAWVKLQENGCSGLRDNL